MIRFVRIHGLAILGVLLILAGVGLTISQQGPPMTALLLFGGAALAVLGVLPMVHLSLARPMHTLENEVDRFTSAWPELTGAEQGAEALPRIREEMDRSRLRLNELEATINVYALEKKQTEDILKSLPIAVLVTNRFDELMLANEAAHRLLGMESENAEGRPLAELLDWKELVELVRGTSKRKIKVPRRMVELTYQPPGHDPKVLRVILSSITDHQDQIAGVATIIQDATKDREIDRMKSEFVANVSHELKAPLASIRAYTEMLGDGEASDEAMRQEFVTVIENESDRLSNMIDSLLDLSRLEAGVVQMEMERVDLIHLLKSAEEAMRPNAVKKEIELSSDISQYIVPVSGDKGQLSRVFVNLLSNAIKYTPEGGKVNLTARLEGDLVRVDVADSGYGIPEEALPNIFEKFYRVKENAHVAKGTGMGLAMVKRILDIHNAEIKVKSSPGEGSCFSVYIPAAE